MAKIYGQLEKAGLEQISSSSTTPAFPGRIFMNVTTPTKAVPYIYNGSNWLQLLTGQTSSLITQNSGYACTVDWSQGVNQQVVLTGPAVISFINPQAGQVHTLVLTQGNNGSGISQYYKATFNMPDQDVRGQGASYQPIGIPRAGDSQVYSWFYSAGIKSSYANVPAVAWAPPSAPSAGSYQVDLSPDGKTLGFAAASTPYQFFYNVYEGVAGRGAIGLKNLVTPTTAPATNSGFKFSLDGQFCFVAGSTSPYIAGYYLDRNTAAGSALVPNTAPGGQVFNLDMHPTGMHLAAAGVTTPFLNVYSFLGAGSGATSSPALVKLANPSTLPAGGLGGCAFSPLGDYIAVAGVSSPYLQTWAFNNYNGNGSTSPGSFGSIVGVMASPPPGVAANSNGVTQPIAWHPQGDYIAMALNSSPYLYVIPFNRSAATYGTPLTISTATSNINGTITALTFTPDGNYMIACMLSSPWVNVYDFSAGSVGAPVTYDGTPFTARVDGVVVSQDCNTAYFTLDAGGLIGMVLPNKTRNYLRLNY